MTKFASAKLKGVSINLKTNEIRLTAEITLDASTLEQAQELEPYLGEDGGLVEITISPKQPKLPHMP